MYRPHVLLGVFLVKMLMALREKCSTIYHIYLRFFTLLFQTYILISRVRRATFATFMIIIIASVTRQLRIVANRCDVTQEHT